jgi:hypothetical protein
MVALTCLSSGCATALVSRSWDHALSWASRDELSVRYEAAGPLPGASVRCRGEQVFEGDGGKLVGTRLSPGDPAFASAVAEAGETLEPHDEVRAVLALDRWRFRDDPTKPWTLIVAENEDDAPTVVTHGPSGWSRHSATDLEEDEPSALKQVAVGAGFAPLFLLSGTCDLATLPIQVPLLLLNPFLLSVLSGHPI